MLNEIQKQVLLDLARAAIQAHLDKTRITLPDDPDFWIKRGIFVSLHKEGRLRGCIGYIKPYKSIVQSVAEMAVAAAFDDPRFSPLKAEEVSLLEIEISILGELLPIKGSEEVVIGRDGLYISHPWGSGLLLPQVATEWRWDADTFVREVCRKAGLPPEAWREAQARLFRFEAEVF